MIIQHRIRLKVRVLLRRTPQPHIVDKAVEVNVILMERLVLTH